MLLLLNKQTDKTEQTDRQSKLTKKEIQIEEKEDKFCQKKKVVIEESTQRNVFLFFKIFQETETSHGSRITCHNLLILFAKLKVIKNPAISFFQS